MSRSIRLAAAVALVAGLLPTYMSLPAAAHHDDIPGCASERITGYIPVAVGTDDETTLHYQVFLPKTDGDDQPDDGKFAAVMDYSGYQPGLHIWDGLARHFTCEGYAVVGLNIRGTGCSGGVFDYFEPRQAEDGREAIEWLTDPENAPWSNGRLAMVGKSYPGITQLFVAGQPMPDEETFDAPDGLVAIVPGHVFGDLYRDVPYPGGILNATFASYWSAGRIVEPFQAPVQDQVFGWDFEDPESWDPSTVNPAVLGEQCMRNTAEHVQNPPENPFVKAIQPQNQFDGDLFYERSPWYWAGNISVPTFLIEAWQDEQVGSRATDLMERFDGVPPNQVRALFTNGDHGEYYGNHVLPHIDRFLEYYLAKKIPAGEQRTIEEEVPGSDPSPSPTPTLPNGKPRKPKGKPSPSPTPTPAPSPSTTTRLETFEEALARYQAEERVQLNWETGGPDEDDRNPVWTETYSSWPPANQEVWRLKLSGDGSLTEGERQGPADVSYTYAPGLGSQARGHELTGGFQAGTWDETPPPGTFAMFETGALLEDKLLAGSASVDLLLSSTAADTDLEVTLTEVRPDGQEMFVQQGWLRASHRALNDEWSNALRPFQTHTLEDVQPLIPGEAAELRVEIFPFAHAFRKDSIIRLYIAAPHVKPDLWGFAALPIPAQNTIVTEGSTIALPLLSGESPKTEQPPACGTIRNQPCRETFSG